MASIVAWVWSGQSFAAVGLAATAVLAVLVALWLYGASNSDYGPLVGKILLWFAGLAIYIAAVLALVASALSDAGG